MRAKSLQSCLTLCDPMDCSPPGSLSVKFSRREYWSGLPCPPPGDLSDPGTEPGSPALAGRFFTTRVPPGKPLCFSRIILNSCKFSPQGFVFQFFMTFLKSLARLLDLRGFVLFCFTFFLSYNAAIYLVL